MHLAFPHYSHSARGQNYGMIASLGREDFPAYGLGNPRAFLDWLLARPNYFSWKKIAERFASELSDE